MTIIGHFNSEKHEKRVSEMSQSPWSVTKYCVVESKRGEKSFLGLLTVWYWKGFIFILIWIDDKNFTFRSHIYVVCNSCFDHMRDLRRICRHLDLDSANYSLLLSCSVVLIIVIHFSMVLLTLTSLGFSVCRINWPAW